MNEDVSQRTETHSRAEPQYNAYPWWSPRIWHGMPLGVWLRLVAEHGGRASPSKWGLLTTISMAAAFNSVCERFTAARFHRRLREPRVTPPPLFIIGHWRSGTTLLHELAMCDARFCCPNTYQCLAPGHFLLTEDVLAPALAWAIPSRRPMDNVATGMDRPQEDEFALMNLGAPSPYRRMAFPRTGRDAPDALDLQKLPAAERVRWQRALRHFLAMLAIRDPRRPVLKSPPHLARVGLLDEMFPGSRFLHIVRDPFVVIPSTLRLWRSLHEVQSLQVDDGSTLERYVFEAFAEMEAAFARDRGRLAPTHLHEMRYEDLVADPVGQLAEAYRQLDLGDFARVRPAIEAQARSISRYRTNAYRHDPRLAGEIARRCRAFIERYGYAVPQSTV
jgi:hypothetical protein